MHPVLPPTRRRLALALASSLLIPPSLALAGPTEGERAATPAADDAPASKPAPAKPGSPGGPASGTGASGTGASGTGASGTGASGTGAAGPAAAPPAASPPVSPPASPSGQGNPPATREREGLRGNREALRDARDQRAAPARDSSAGGLGASGRSGEERPARATTARSGSSIPSEISEVLRFEPAELDLGEMTAEVQKSGMMKFINISEQPLRITALKAGCGCTTARAPTEPIPVGGSTEIQVTLRPGPKQGTTLRKHVDVHLDGFPPVRFHLTGRVAEVVTVVPDILTPVLEDPASGRITLQSVDDEPFRIIGSTPDVVGDFLPEAQTNHVVHIDWERWVEAGRPVKVSLKTDHPRLATTSVIVRRVALPGDADRSALAPGQDRASRARAVADQQAAARRAARAERAQETGGAPLPEFNPPVHPRTAELIAAVRSSDLDAIAEALRNGAKLDEHEAGAGRNALLWAARGGNQEVVAALLKAGAAPGVTERSGKAALAVAAEAGCAECVKLLLDAGAEVNHRDQIQGTALLWAAGFGNPESVRELLRGGADPSLADTNGLTPLLWAAGVGQAGAVEALLDAKADLASTDRIDGDNALMRAARSGTVESAALLISRGAAVNDQNRRGSTALHLAAGRGSLEKVRLLLDAKADLSIRDGEGRTALELAQARTDAEGKAIAAHLGSLASTK